MWFGACGYADDICLLANNRFVLQKMVTICESFGKEHNLIFSTDPTPAKSKTKCVMFCGNNSSNYPLPVTLDGKQLPWVQKTEHLGHILHQNLSMESDSYRAKASFMTRSSDCRDSLHFAESEQRVQAIQLYCSDAYGALLYDFRSEYAESLFKAWNIQVRLAWDVPPTTHTWLVEGYFCDRMKSLKNQVLGRYPKFVQKLLDSPSKEIRFLSRILLSDRRSQLNKNVYYLSTVTNVNILDYPIYKYKQLLPRKSVPASDQWRLGLLTSLLNARKTKNFNFLNLNKAQCQDMINSLCSS